MHRGNCLRFDDGIWMRPGIGIVEPLRFVERVELLLRVRIVLRRHRVLHYVSALR